MDYLKKGVEMTAYPFGGKSNYILTLYHEVE